MNTQDYYKTIKNITVLLKDTNDGGSGRILEILKNLKIEHIVKPDDCITILLKKTNNLRYESYQEMMDILALCSSSVKLEFNSILNWYVDIIICAKKRILERYSLMMTQTIKHNSGN